MFPTASSYQHLSIYPRELGIHIHAWFKKRSRILLVLDNPLVNGFFKAYIYRVTDTHQVLSVPKVEDLLSLQINCVGSSLVNPNKTPGSARLPSQERRANHGFSDINRHKVFKQPYFAPSFQSRPNVHSN